MAKFTEALQERTQQTMAIIFKKRHLAKIKEKQRNCPHEHIDSYNHGYHRFCKDCGKEM